MTDTVIKVENLGKRYVLGRNRQGRRYQTLREGLVEAVRAPFRRLRSAPPAPATDDEEFWALRDVSFEIKRGEVVGIIGRNGAGKSTLLKILSRITDPTNGRIALRGRVASLLEVGTGFHAELTGRENIFLNGAILGMHRAEIKAKFDEIVAFAEVERFLDTPVKRYSSGMYVRLAFAVAAHLEPEILIVDEVLAVGDAEFQKKCLGKMEKVASAGRTVLFVSHNMATVSELTTRCLILNGGRNIYDGPTPQAVTEYLSVNRAAVTGYRATPSGDIPQVIGVEVKTSEPGSVQANGRPLEINVELFAPRPVRSACLSVEMVNQMQQPIAHIWLYNAQQPFLREGGRVTVRFRVPKLRIYQGHYTLTTHLAESGGEYFGRLDQLCPFEVIMLHDKGDFPWQPNECAYLEEYSWDVIPSPRDSDADVFGEIGSEPATLR